jgi:hypothetical protein
VNAVVTLGGLAVGLILILREFAPTAWATLMKKTGKGGGEAAEGAGKFNVKAHVPFLAGTAIGMLAISTPGGIIGTGAAKILGISNAIGDKALSAGVGSASTAASRGVHAMDQYGGLIVLLLVASVIILRKALPKPQKRQMFAGVWSGCTLGLTAGAAGVTAAVLVPLAEQLGHALGGAV